MESRRSVKIIVEIASGKIKVLFLSNFLVENIVVEEAITNWFGVLKVIKYSEGLDPSKIPKNKSYETFSEFCEGPIHDHQVSFSERCC